MRRTRVGRLESFPAGRPVLLEIDGHRYALVRVGDAVHVLDDACPHAGGPLSEGAVLDGALVCPYHAWMWDLGTGVCVAPSRAARVAIHATRIEAGEVWVELP